MRVWNNKYDIILLAWPLLPQFLDIMLTINTVFLIKFLNIVYNNRRALINHYYFNYMP